MEPLDPRGLIRFRAFAAFFNSTPAFLRRCVKQRPQTSGPSTAERNPHQPDTDMSFTIHSQTAAACPSLGVQERNAQDRRNSHRPANHGRKSVGSGDTGVPTVDAQVSSAIRRAQDCQAVLSDALVFLQTQDEAMACLQTLLSEGNSIDLAILEGITGESFNGIGLFASTASPDTIRFEDLETQDAAEIERPAKPVAAHLANPQTLGMRLAEAREKNHREQLHIERMMEFDRQHAISESFHLGHISNSLEAGRAKDFSRETLLRSAPAALAVQANARKESVLRLFH